MKFRLKKDLAFRRIAGQVFIVDAAASRMHELNGTAALVWEGLASGRDEEAVAAALAAEYDIAASAASADAAAFTKELLAAGLITKAEK
ncbi:MAG: PqqD family peptide modification chaperone [Elusimicrobiales bacterium]